MQPIVAHVAVVAHVALVALPPSHARSIACTHTYAIGPIHSRRRWHTSIDLISTQPSASRRQNVSDAVVYRASKELAHSIRLHTAMARRPYPTVGWSLVSLRTKRKGVGRLDIDDGTIKDHG